MWRRGSPPPLQPEHSSRPQTADSRQQAAGSRQQTAGSRLHRAARLGNYVDPSASDMSERLSLSVDRLSLSEELREELREELLEELREE